MVIKIGGDLVGNQESGYPAFIASGMSGQHGQPGGNGGVGGFGGAGGAACCNGGSQPQGQPGGNGDFGAGGAGGDAGDGGQPGTLWIAVAGSLTGSAGTSYLQVDGGLAGQGGPGGWGGYNTTLTSLLVRNQCDLDEQCPPGDGGGSIPQCTQTCDVENAIRLLVCNVSSGNIVGSNIEFNGSPSAGTYDIATGNLSMNYGCSTCCNTYIANWLSTTPCEEIFKKIALIEPVIGNMYIDYSMTQIVTGISCASSLFTYPIEVIFRDANGVALIKFTKASANAGGIFEDLFNGTFCNSGSCNPIGTTTGTLPNGSSATQADPGDNGHAGNTGVITDDPVNNPTSNGVLDAPAVWAPMQLGNKETAKGVMNCTLFPNPATRQVWLEVNSEIEDNALVEIVDLAGRMLQKRTIKLSKSQQRVDFDISLLSAGSYLMNITVKNHKEQLPFIVR
jgi:hypothetical protein